jgi:hypothetical protein
MTGAMFDVAGYYNITAVMVNVNNGAMRRVAIPMIAEDGRLAADTSADCLIAIFAITKLVLQSLAKLPRNLVMDADATKNRES